MRPPIASATPPRFAGALDAALTGAAPPRRRSAWLVAGVGAATCVAVALGTAPAARPPQASAPTGPARAALAPALAAALDGLEPALAEEARGLRAALEDARGPDALPDDERAALEALLGASERGPAAEEVRAAARGLLAGPAVRAALAGALHGRGLRLVDRGDAGRGDELLRLADALGVPPRPEVAPRVVARWLAVAQEAAAGTPSGALVSSALRDEPWAVERLLAILEPIARAQRAAPERDLLDEPACAARLALDLVPRNMDFSQREVRVAARAVVERLLRRVPDDPAVCLAAGLAWARAPERSTPVLAHGLERLVRARAGAGAAWRTLHAAIIQQLRWRLVEQDRLDELVTLVVREAARDEALGQVRLLSADLQLEALQRRLDRGDTSQVQDVLASVVRQLDALDAATLARHADWSAKVRERHEQLANRARLSQLGLGGREDR